MATNPAAVDPPTAAVLVDADAALAAADELATELRAGAAERDAAGEVPWAAIRGLDASGLLAINVPAEHGGIDGGPVLLAEVVRRLAVADPAIAQITQGHFFMVDAIALIAEPSVCAEVFSDVLDGRRLGNGLAERGSKHAQDLRTRLHADGAGGLTLTGAKGYGTGSLSSHTLGISALDDEDELVLVLVPSAAPGVAFDEEWYAMGQRATISGGTTLDGVAVAPDHVLPLGELLANPQLVGARAQLVHAAIEVGIGRAALDDAAWFLREKARPFFEPVRLGLFERAVDDPYALHRIGRLRARVRAAEAMLAIAASELAALGPVPADEEEAGIGSLTVAEVKAFASEVAVEAGSELFAVSGASSTDRRLGLDRHWRNARTHSIHDPIDWKYHHLGAHAVDGRLPPSHGQL
jgi:SfnB family sulfur acquisition oxidoreductase